MYYYCGNNSFNVSFSPDILYGQRRPRQFPRFESQLGEKFVYAFPQFPRTSYNVFIQFCSNFSQFHQTSSTVFPQFPTLFPPVSPDIIYGQTSTDTTANEGDNVALRCAAEGHPGPRIVWHREGGDMINTGDRRGAEGERGGRIYHKKDMSQG